MKQQPASFTIPTYAILTCLLLLSFSVSCKSITGSDDEFSASIVVSNNFGATLDIHLDDSLQFALESGSTQAIENLTQGLHTLEAFLTGTSTLIESESFDATAEGDYEWPINGKATIVVTNKYGEILQIYESGEYLGVVEDDDSVSIADVPFGSFSFEATLLNQTAVVASASVTVTAIAEYTWTITK